MPQPTGASERVRRTLCATVRCILVDDGLPSNLWGKRMITEAYLAIEFPIHHSRWQHHTRFYTVRTLTYLTSRSPKPGPSFTSRNQLNLGTRPEGWCAVSAKTRVLPTACGTPGSELSLNQPEENVLDEKNKKHYQSITGAVRFHLTTSSLPLTSWLGLVQAFKSSCGSGQAPTLQYDRVRKLLNYLQAKRFEDYSLP